MSDVMFFGVLRMPYEMAMADDLSRYQFYTRAQEAADRVEKAERELAERAVSPAESVQSVDTPEFRKLIDAHHDEAFSYNAEYRDAKLFPEWKDLVVHIDASRAAAHAEGRRSAMEELHPQWLKEKERADRAEATDAVRLITIYHHRKRIEELETELAARQAPDMQALREAFWNFDEGRDYGTADPVIMSLCKRAAWEGWKGKALLAQPLQQEGGKYVPWAAQQNGGLVRAALIDLLVTEPFALRGAGDFQSQQDLIARFTRARKALSESQPSDNLQQASKPNADCSGDPSNCPDNEGYGCACSGTATTAEAVADKAWKCSHCGSSTAEACDAVGCHGHEAGEEEASATDGPLKQFLKVAEDAGITHLNFAQATPEGADADTEYKPEYKTLTDHRGRVIGVQWVNAADMPRIQSARHMETEPFAWALPGVGFNYTFEQSRENPWKPDAGAIPLYRAAPPQQVDTGGLQG